MHFIYHLCLSFKNYGSYHTQYNAKPCWRTGGHSLFLGCELPAGAAGWNHMGTQHATRLGDRDDANHMSLQRPSTCLACVLTAARPGTAVQCVAASCSPNDCCYLPSPVMGSVFCCLNCIYSVIIGLFPYFHALSVCVSARQRALLLSKVTRPSLRVASHSPRAGISNDHDNLASCITANVLLPFEILTLSYQSSTTAFWDSGPWWG